MTTRWLTGLLFPLAGCIFPVPVGGDNDDGTLDCAEAEADQKAAYDAIVVTHGQPSFICEVSEGGTRIYGWDCDGSVEVFFWEGQVTDACVSYGQASGSCGAVELPSYLTDEIAAAGASSPCAFLVPQ